MTITAADMQWLLQRNGAEPEIWLATFTGPGVPGAIRIARNTEDVTSRGETFSKSWFNLSLPTDNDGAPRASIEVPNINREIGLALLENRSQITASFELVRPSDFDRVVFSARALKLRVANISPLVVSGELSAVEYDREPYIAIIVSPAAFPGLARMRR